MSLEYGYLDSSLSPPTYWLMWRSVLETRSKSKALLGFFPISNVWLSRRSVFVSFSRPTWVFDLDLWIDTDDLNSEDKKSKISLLLWSEASESISLQVLSFACLPTDAIFPDRLISILVTAFMSDFVDLDIDVLELCDLEFFVRTSDFESTDLFLELMLICSGELTFFERSRSSFNMASPRFRLLGNTVSRPTFCLLLGNKVLRSTVCLLIVAVSSTSSWFALQKRRISLTYIRL